MGKMQWSQIRSAACSMLSAWYNFMHAAHMGLFERKQATQHNNRTTPHHTRPHQALNPLNTPTSSRGRHPLAPIWLISQTTDQTFNPACLRLCRHPSLRTNLSSSPHPMLNTNTPTSSKGRHPFLASFHLVCYQ
mmetsp:Transcript_28200/g.47328  ORF Transcript_28200/g.47328 Transcript_28200/m.47328 type:complete len:134 (-) Transcript_28200:780-1181(-)